MVKRLGLALREVKSVQMKKLFVTDHLYIPGELLCFSLALPKLILFSSSSTCRLVEVRVDHHPFLDKDCGPSSSFAQRRKEGAR